MYHNPKEIKQEMKFVGLFFMDIVIVVSCTSAGHYFGQVLPISQIMRFLLAVLGFFFGLFLAWKPFGERMLFVLFHMTKWDRNRYHPIEITDIQTVKQAKKEEYIKRKVRGY